MPITEKEVKINFLNSWLSKLNQEIKDHETELENHEKRETELFHQRRVINKVLKDESNSPAESMEKFKKHFNVAHIDKEFEQLRSQHQQLEEKVKEKIQFNKMAIAKIEELLQE